MNQHFFDRLFLLAATPLVIGLLFYYLTGYGGALQLSVIMLPYFFILYVINELRQTKLYKRLGKTPNYIVGIIFILISTFVAIYLTLELWNILRYRFGSYNTLDLLTGLLMAALVMEFARRRYLGIFVLNIILIIYAAFGWIFPGILYHPGVPLTMLLPSVGIAFDTGVFADLTQIALTIIAPFLFFAAVLQGFGVLETLIAALKRLFKRRPLLLPQIGVLSALTTGMVTGSAAACATMVGSYTIPLLVRIGLPSLFVASLIAAAAIGSQLMPPIMGASAFVMANYMGVHYFDVITRAFLPALLYFLGISFAAYLVTTHHFKQAQPTIDEDIKLTRQDLFNLLIFAIGLTTILYLLGIRLHPAYAVTITTLFILAILATRTLVTTKGTTKQKLQTLQQRLTVVIHSFTSTATDIVLLLASLNIAVAMFTITGVPTKIGMMLLDIGGENLALAVLFAFLFGWIVGLGLPPVATYIIEVVLISFYMIRLGVDPWVVHFFAFFVALYSELSPPTSVSAAVTSRIAGTSFTKTMLYSHIVAISLFTLMIGIFTYPQLVSPPSIQQFTAFSIVLLATFGLTFALLGTYKQNKTIDIALRTVLAITSATLLISPTHLYVTLPITAILLLLGIIKTHKHA